MTADLTTSIDPHRLVFVGGLHRSGTTALGRVLAAHPEVSGFADTGAMEDEGQHLQSVYPPARHFGGPGRFAFQPAAHRIEADQVVASQDAHGLLSAWTPHWDLDRRLLVEKSPPNLVMGRYLQSVFPGSALIIIVRHPVVVSLATKKWRRFTSLGRLVEHWFTAHDLLRADAPHLERLLVVRYEDLVASPEATLGRVASFLGLGTALGAALIDATRSDPYRDVWHRLGSSNAAKRRRRARIELRYRDRASRWGYDITDLSARARWSFDGLQASAD